MSGSVLLILAAVAAAALLLFGRRDKARRIGLDENRTTARQRMEAARPHLSQADLDEVGRLLADGRKIEAIKLVRKKTGMGLAEAKEFIEHHGLGGDPARTSPATRSQPWATEQGPGLDAGPWAAEEAPAHGLSPADFAVLERLLATGHKIAAIKLVRERTGMGLAEAKDFVEGPGFGGGR